MNTGKIQIKRTILGTSTLEFEPENCCKNLMAENERLKTELIVKDKEIAELKAKMKNAMFLVDEKIIGMTEAENNNE